MAVAVSEGVAVAVAVRLGTAVAVGEEVAVGDETAVSVTVAVAVGGKGVGGRGVLVGTVIPSFTAVAVATSFVAKRF